MNLLEYINQQIEESDQAVAELRDALQRAIGGTQALIEFRRVIEETIEKQKADAEN
ncbi:MAG: hypothetical protein WC455_24805 [Dehalococcoidia bacterium]|jgi:hypothetical protein